VTKPYLKLIKTYDYSQCDDPYVTTAPDGTIVNMDQFPVKTKNGYEHRPGLVGMLGQFRYAVDYDLHAAVLLQHVAWRFKPGTKKLQRWDKEWIAQSRWDWAAGAGLKWSEFVKQALPRLKKAGEKYGFLEAHTMKLKGVNVLWMHLDPEKVPGLTTAAMPSYASRMLGNKIIGQDENPEWEREQKLEQKKCALEEKKAKLEHQILKLQQKLGPET
jgi:hypothetical protein